MAVSRNHEGTNYLSVEFNVWYNPEDESIHITNRDAADMHTTVNDKPGSARCHRNLFGHLATLLKENGRWPDA